MVFIFGRKSSFLRHEKLDGLVCPACRSENTLNGAVVTEYGHITWIPLLSYGKRAVVHCGHCKKLYVEKDMPAEWKPRITRMLNSARIPLYHYTAYFFLLGIILPLIGPLFKLVTGGSEKEDDSPKVGDIFTTRANDGRYSLLKMTAISQDSYYLAKSNFAAHSLNVISERIETEEYLGRVWVFAIKDWEKGKQTERIGKVRRYH